MNFKFLELKKEESIAIVSFNREKALNALNSAMLDEISDMTKLLKNDEEVNVVIFTGKGKAFIAGADISEMEKLNSFEGMAFGKKGSEVFTMIENLEKPTIAAINGYALGGGCEFAMACDIRLASSKAKFGQPEVGLGIIPGFSGTQRLPKLVGLAKAKELIFTGDIISSEEAKSIGLITYIYEADELMENAKTLAKKISKNAQLAVRNAKRSINEGFNKDMVSASSIEATYFGMCFSSEDQKNGMKAFLNKEKVKFITK
ncbi:enoyl-CoA hydratase-related protein [Helicovermis profundi]|uniref:short-chain-enoyl-CoA hydratase n=1 Tax=Helicovermis profundi TaxID=3065157 RepID=A0AAU9E4I9_9FIRM|nr:short-chain-enoyl-CoA hydratase [Clostridia bacterium S502]